MARGRRVDSKRSATGVGLHREAELAGEWLVNHPQRRRSSIAQFLSNWLKRTQDDAAKRRAPPVQRGDSWPRRSAAVEGLRRFVERGQ